MSTAAAIDRIPEWTQGDRLRKARQRTGMTTREFAEQIGVSQKTVTDAEGDRRSVRKITLNAWSLVSGVPREWLESGTVPEGPGSDDRPITHEYPSIGGDVTHQYVSTSSRIMDLPGPWSAGSGSDLPAAA